jgi:hypothetical protein
VAQDAFGTIIREKNMKAAKEIKRLFFFKNIFKNILDPFLDGILL